MSRLPMYVALAVALVAPAVSAADRCSVKSSVEVVPLVELYTSEGCSSCPPADRWLSKNYGQGGANFLAFHVDYWDDIGWPDRFASGAYSQRQRQRVHAAGGQSVYTPQVMVGSQVSAPWRSASGFEQTLAGARGKADAGLALRLEPVDGETQVRIGAARSDGSSKPAQVWLAQYVDNQTTQVRAGENRGATLHHDRIVRRLWGPWALDAKPLSKQQLIPSQSGAWGLVAFVQDAQGRTLQSLDLPATDCVATVTR